MSDYRKSPSSTIDQNGTFISVEPLGSKKEAVAVFARSSATVFALTSCNELVITASDVQAYVGWVFANDEEGSIRFYPRKDLGADTVPAVNCQNDGSNTLDCSSLNLQTFDNNIDMPTFTAHMADGGSEILNIVLQSGRLA